MMNGNLRMTVIAHFSIPKSRTKVKIGEYYPQRPDIDNLVKIVADSLNKLAYHDDAQVVELHGKKLWSDRDYVEVTLEEING